MIQVGIQVGLRCAVVLVADLLCATVARWSEVDHQLSEVALADRVVERLSAPLQQTGIDSHDVWAISVVEQAGTGAPGSGGRRLGQRPWSRQFFYQPSVCTRVGASGSSACGVWESRGAYYGFRVA